MKFNPPRNPFLYFLFRTLAVLFWSVLVIEAPAQKIIMGGLGKTIKSSLPAPIQISSGLSRSATAPPANFRPTYSGLTTGEEVAVDYAFQILSTLLRSDVAIGIEITKTSLPAGTLAEVSLSRMESGFTGAPLANTYYPTTLSNDLTGCDRYPRQLDLTMVLNSNTNWYLGTDANPGPSEYDLVTVVLQQSFQALGLMTSGQVDDGLGTAECDGVAGNGCLGWQAASPEYPLIFDHFLVNGSNQSLLSTYTNGTPALAMAFTNDDLFWSGSQAIAANGGTKPKLFAPTTFAPGLSVQHLDENTYPAGDINSFLTPFLAMGEAIHYPGPIALAMLADLGWNLLSGPEAYFRADAVGFTGKLHRFVDGSAGASTREWDFENDGIIDAVGQKVNHTYSVPGVYQARLQINGDPTQSYLQTIEVFPSPSLPYFQDFESGSGGFFAYGPGCDQWQLGPSASSNFNGLNGTSTIGGSNSWITNQNADYGEETDYYLQSPPFDLSGLTGDVFLAFDFRSLVYNGAGFNLEFSLDSGMTWQTLGYPGDPEALANWYGQASIAGLNGEPGWQVLDPSSVFRAEYRLNAFLGEPDLRFRFHLGASSGFALDGVQLDNFEIYGGTVLREGLIDLTASTLGNQAQVQWVIDLPINVERIFLDRAFGQEAFKTVYQTSPNTPRHQYTFTEPLPMAGTWYYRLGALLADGSLVYSSTLAIDLAIAPPSFYPNPFVEQLRFSCGEEGAFTLSISTADGRQLLRRRGMAISGQDFQLETRQLPKGLLIWELETPGGVFHGKLYHE